MANIIPTVIFPGYTNNAASDTFTFSYAPGVNEMPELNDAKADAASGDVRAVLYAILEKFADYWTANPNARPDFMTLVRSSSVTDGADPYITRTYNISFRVALASLADLVPPA